MCYSKQTQDCIWTQKQVALESGAMCRIHAPGAPYNDNSFLIDDKSYDYKSYNNLYEFDYDQAHNFNEYHSLFDDTQDVGYCSSVSFSDGSPDASPRSAMEAEEVSFHLNELAGISTCIVESPEIDKTCTSELVTTKDVEKYMDHATQQHSPLVTDPTGLYGQLNDLPKEDLISWIIDLHMNFTEAGSYIHSHSTH